MVVFWGCWCVLLVLGLLGGLFWFGVAIGLLYCWVCICLRLFFWVCCANSIVW